LSEKVLKVVSITGSLFLLFFTLSAPNDKVCSFVIAPTEEKCPSY